MTKLEIIVGRGGKRGRTISFSEDALKEMEEFRREQMHVNNELNLSEIVETACWRMINDLKKTATKQTSK